jgi:hypothetical protein
MPARFFRTPRLFALAALVAVGGAAGCGSDDPTSSSREAAVAALAGVPSGNATADRSAIDAAYRAVRELAKNGACANGTCEVIPVGEKPCGGAGEWVPYCPTTTDVPALKAAAAEVVRAERAYNERYGIVASDCSVAKLPACTALPAGGR